MKLYIVDDDANRGEAILNACLSAGKEAIWLRPTLAKSRMADREIYFDTLSNLIDYIHIELTTPAGWFWDMELKFLDNTSFDKDDYEINGDAFALLRQILVNGGVISIISSGYSTQNVSARLVNADCPKNSIHTYLIDYGSQRTEDDKKKFCDLAVKRLLASFSGGIRELWSSDWMQHFSDSGSGLPHDYINCEWDKFLPIIKDILGDRHHPVPDSLLEVLRLHFNGYYEATKTLIGAYSKCHTGQSYAPCLSVLSILTLRAACMSHVWNEERLITLARAIAPTSEMRTIWLACSKHQEMSYMQEWVAILADEVLPDLMKFRNTALPAELIDGSCDIAGRYFRLVFSGTWDKLIGAIHDLSGSNGGGMTSKLIRLNQALGNCGPRIGRKQLCTVNAWIENNKTYIQFSATS